MDQDESFYFSENNQDLLPWILTESDQSSIDEHLLGFGIDGVQTHTNYAFDSCLHSPQTPGSGVDRQGPPSALGEAESSLAVFDTVPVSTAFHAGAVPHPNTLFLSSDGVLFYVHDKTILDRCPKAFEGYLSAPLSGGRARQQMVQLDAPSAELNIILHALYGTSVAAHSPDTTTLIKAIDRMPAYSIPPDSVIRPSTELYSLLLAHAPLRPLELYALAARHSLPSLAISVSTYLLSYDLTTITDDMAERMGAVYLKKLAVLHLERHRLLKHILLRPPHPHPPTDDCRFKDQDKLMRTWALLSAYFVWDRHADLSPRHMRIALGSLSEQLTCASCKKVLEDKIKDAVVQWASFKVNHFASVMTLCEDTRTVNLITFNNVSSLLTQYLCSAQSDTIRSHMGLTGDCQSLIKIMEISWKTYTRHFHFTSVRMRT